jgi:pimeloyl-ACP methyl ester carboxylesterase
MLNTLVVLVSAIGLGSATNRISQGTALSPDGVAIRYQVAGQGSPAIVLIHCWLCDQHLWDAVVPVLARNHMLVTLDLAGHGGSGGTRKVWTIEAFGRDVKAVVDQLGFERVILVGHSMGGLVALEAARLLPAKLAGLVPLDILLNVEEVMKPEEVDAYLKPFRADFKTAVEKFIRDYMFVPSSDPALIERVVTQVRAAPPEMAVGALEAAWKYDARGGLHEIKAPIMAINADKFPTNREANRRYASQFDAVIMKGVGHYLMLEDPARFTELLLGVVNDMSARKQLAEQCEAMRETLEAHRGHDLETTVARAGLNRDRRACGRAPRSARAFSRSGFLPMT